MAIRCLLWDFGDTLCDEMFIWGSGPVWRELYDSFDGGWTEAWMTGEIDTAQFCERAAQSLDMSPEQVAEYMRACCERIEYFDFTFRYFKARKMRQAIVTVNPDLFSEVIAPYDKLDQYVDTIVTSWEEGTVDKGVLCQAAIARIDATLKPSESILIDNKEANLEAWRARGGLGYLFRSDDEFERAVAGGVEGLLTA